uniref:Uncharacterized protein n=1 Tax=Glossina pallidipes TaxID=7398 RepID=A0A1A9ZGY5_GLOPL
MKSPLPLEFAVFNSQNEVWLITALLFEVVVYQKGQHSVVINILKHYLAGITLTATINLVICQGTFVVAIRTRPRLQRRAQSERERHSITESHEIDLLTVKIELITPLVYVLLETVPKVQEHAALQHHLKAPTSTICPNQSIFMKYEGSNIVEDIRNYFAHDVCITGCPQTQACDYALMTSNCEVNPAEKLQPLETE